MRLISKTIVTLGIAAMVAPAPAFAQQTAGITDLRPGLTKQEFEALTAELGSVLRFRQLADPATLGRGGVDLSVEFANTAMDDRFSARSMPMPRIAARLGVSTRVDLGAWGGYDTDADYGMAGADVKVTLLKQGPSMPVTVSLRPSVTSIIGPSELWIGNASIDVAVSRTMGAFTPYAGVAASGSLGVERSNDVHLDPVVADHSVSYAGLSYRWRAFVVAAEAEKGAIVSYGVRIGTRF